MAVLKYLTQYMARSSYLRAIVSTIESMAQASVNIEVIKGPNENNLSVLRRFTKRVQGAGLLPRVRSKRYTERTPSVNTRKAKTVSYLKKKEVTAELVKLGKVNEVSKFSRRRR